MTISALARAAGLSRSAVLYYESIGLLRPATRSGSNYRVYGDKELRVLRQICAYRDAGLTLEDIRNILSEPGNQFAAILQNRLIKISEEVERLHQHQRAIARLLHGTRECKGATMITKQKWTQIMQAAGLSEDDMHRWHAEFERAAPEDHQEFLHFLHIADDEVQSIRDWSRQYSAGSQRPRNSA